jgi:hypothetical protein
MPTSQITEHSVIGYIEGCMDETQNETPKFVPRGLSNDQAVPKIDLLLGCVPAVVGQGTGYVM